MSQDVFQLRLDTAYSGIENVTGIADDIIVTGATIKEHDQAFKAMMDTTRKHNIGMNSRKLQFRQTQVKFYKHDITDRGIQPSEDKLQSIKNLRTPETAKELQTILGIVTSQPFLDQARNADSHAARADKRHPLHLGSASPCGPRSSQARAVHGYNTGFTTQTQ